MTALVAFINQQSLHLQFVKILKNQPWKSTAPFWNSQIPKDPRPGPSGLTKSLSSDPQTYKPEPPKRLMMIRIPKSRQGPRIGTSSTFPVATIAAGPGATLLGNSCATCYHESPAHGLCLLVFTLSPSGSPPPGQWRPNTRPCHSYSPALLPKLRRDSRHCYSVLKTPAPVLTTLPGLPSCAPPLLCSLCLASHGRLGVGVKRTAGGLFLSRHLSLGSK